MIANEGTSRQAERESSAHWLDLERLQVYSVAMLIIYVAILVIWAWVTNGFTSDKLMRPGADFSVFWSASHLSLRDSPIKVYDFASLRPIIAAFGSMPAGDEFFLPWLYPPTFLLFVLPLSLLPHALSYLFFISVTGFTYAASLVTLLGLRARRRSAIWLPIIASPGVFLVAMIGQNSFLTAGIAAWSILLMEKRPVLSGMFVGLLCIKPQLAMVFPVALVAARAWKTLWIAGLTALLILLASVCLFGWETVQAFFTNATLIRERLLDHGKDVWSAAPTVLAATLLAGGSVGVAYLLHGVVAALAMCAAFQVWRKDSSPGLRAAVLAVATLLVSPYVWYYELTWLGIAIAGLVSDGVRRGWLRGERELLVAAWLLPLYLGINRGLDLPQIGPIILVLLMLMILRRMRVPAAAA